jgi:hyperosmotically inducible protein
MKSLVVVLCGLGISLSVSGCWLVAAGAGAEAGYVASQDDRSVGETLDDQRITAEVKTKLLADQEVSGLDINVDTFKKEVTLKGVVDNQNEADLALAIAQNVKGVRVVHSKLFVD